MPTDAPRLYDSNILIDFLNEVPPANWLVNSSSDRHISVVTWIEVLAGVGPEAEPKVRTFLSTFTILPSTTEVMERAVFLRKTTRLKLPDALILATAQTTSRTLVTRNSRDFPPGSTIHNPYQL